MTNYKELLVKRPTKGLAADPLPEEVPLGWWHQHDQFHVVDERIHKYAGWQRWTPLGDYGGQVIGLP